MPACCERYLLASKMRAGTMAAAMLSPTLLLVVGVAYCIGFLVGGVMPRGPGARSRMPFRENVGEALVADMIGWGLKRPHVLLNNITFRAGERTSQSDHILVTETGVFVIETKHYDGWIFGNPREEQWTQVKFRKKSRFQNPVRQNYGHVKALQALFNLPSDAFFSLVVFTGEAEFKTDLGPAVVKLAELLGHLNGKRPVLFDERQMAYIVGRIEMKRMRRSIETDEYHLNYVRGLVKARQFDRSG
jgi:hypothetical protein